jgi:hypothetical protein
MQGKAERVDDLLALLREFYADKLTALVAHEAGSRAVRQYDANNTYQYIVNREETQLAWLSTAILELGGTVPDESRRSSLESQSNIFERDAQAAQAFVDRWRPRVEGMSHARHRNMLRVILGETLEQKRFFEQALAGQTDLLGRRGEQAGPRVGEVLPTRWIE